MVRRSRPKLIFFGSPYFTSKMKCFDIVATYITVRARGVGPSGKTFEMETLNIVNLSSKKGTNGPH